MVADARQVLHATAADQHDRVLLQVVCDPRYIGSDLNSVGQANARDLAQRRVRLLGGLGVDAGADAAALRRTLQRWAGSLITGGRAALLDELMERRHSNSFNCDSRHSGLKPLLQIQTHADEEEGASFAYSCVVHTNK